MNRREFVFGFAAGSALAATCGTWARQDVRQERSPAVGPLQVCRDNPRYFADPQGNPVYLTGSHTWSNLVDIGPTDPPPKFDFERYLSWMESYNHNFIRLWRWELTTWDTRGNNPRWRKEKPHFAEPHPWPRTGPGLALDGKPRFDLSRFDEQYFKRLRERVELACKRGFYVSVMLFEGWGMQFCPNAWNFHPFNPANNINGVGKDINPDSRGLEIYRLVSSRVTEVQHAYVRKVIDTVGDLPNVLYEISNENHPASTQWQYHMIRFIHADEERRGRRHPVGMTFQYRGGSNKTLFDSPAEWISPNPEGGYRDNPPPADGRKVILSDTDHLWGIGGNQAWVWKSFTRGLNPLFMDPYDGVVLGKAFDPQFEPIRRSLGYTRRFAARIDLRRAIPDVEAASSTFCLAVPGNEYVVYLPQGGAVEVNVEQRGTFMVEWFNPSKGRMVSKSNVTCSGGQRPSVKLEVPFSGDAVLYLKRTS